jgi:endonuclease/exonuclease/phosphatase (EEP) superfamily protein YafD
MRFLRFVIYTASLLFFTGMLAGYFGWLHPAFDSFSAFRVHFAVLALVCGLLLALAGGVLGGTSMVVTAALVLYTTFGSGINEPRPENSNSAGYRLLQINVRFNNPTPKQLLQLIGRTKPDVITAQEVTPRWRAEFATIKSAYPFQLFCAAHRKIGDVAIVSKRPFVDASSNYCGQGEAVAIESIDFGGRVIEFASVHLYWPWPHSQSTQILEMKPILESLAGKGRRVLIAGDLNAPRWSQAARDIARYSQTSATNYKGGSWLAFEFPARWTKWIGLPIDNVFFSGVRIRSIQTQMNVGSDHLPMLIEFSIPVRDIGSYPEPMTGSLYRVAVNITSANR